MVQLDLVAMWAGHVKNDGTQNKQKALTYTQPGEDYAEGCLAD